MAGLGLAPVGFFPFGFGSPVSVDDPPDAPDQARFVDFLTGDYVVGDDGELERMPITRQRVLLSLATVRGSSTALPAFGVTLPKIIGSNDDALVRQAVERALRPLIDEGSIVLNLVEVDHGNPIGRSRITVDYTDTATEENDRVNV